MLPQVQSFHDVVTGTVSHVVYTGVGSSCALIDSVLDTLTNRYIDLIADGIDLAFRAASAPLESEDVSHARSHLRRTSSSAPRN